MICSFCDSVKSDDIGMVASSNEQKFICGTCVTNFKGVIADDLANRVIIDMRPMLQYMKSRKE